MIKDSAKIAVTGGRCLKEPAGCGKLIQLKKAPDGSRLRPYYDFPTPAMKDEWKATGLCPPCQIKAQKGSHSNSA